MEMIERLRHCSQEVDPILLYFERKSRQIGPRSFKTHNNIFFTGYQDFSNMNCVKRKRINLKNRGLGSKKIYT